MALRRLGGKFYPPKLVASRIPVFRYTSTSLRVSTRIEISANYSYILLPGRAENIRVLRERRVALVHDAYSGLAIHPRGDL